MKLFFLALAILVFLNITSIDAAAGIYLRRSESGLIELLDRPVEGGHKLFDLDLIESAQVELPSSEELSDIIADAAEQFSLPEALIYAVMRMESAGDSMAVSPAGAQGLMQLMPGTAAEMGVENVFDPRDNIFGGSRYLKQLLERYQGDIELTLAGYNAGPGNVAKYGGVPPFEETRVFIRRTLEAFEQFREKSDKIFTYRDERGITTITNIH